MLPPDGIDTVEAFTGEGLDMVPDDVLVFDEGGATGLELPVVGPEEPSQ